MKKMLLMSAVVVATFCALAAETWVKCTTGECDYFVTINGVRWSVLQSESTYKLGTYVFDWPIIPDSTSGDIVVPSSLRTSSVSTIPGAAFYGCDKITSIGIPSTITQIGGYETFQVCTALTNFIVAANNPKYCSQDGLLLSKDKTRLVSYPRAKAGEFVIPSSVTSIEDDAVSICRFKSVWIPDGVVNIGQYAFAFSEQLDTVRFPKTLSTIGYSAFIMCNLASVDFEGAPPTGVTGADIKQDAAIRYNVAYQSKWLPVIEQCGWTNAKPYTPVEPKPEGGPYKETVEGIEWNFYVDANLNASVGGTNGCAISQSTAGVISIPLTLGGRSVTRIGYRAFLYCTRLTSVTIPSSVKSIGEQAFDSCGSLTSMTIPEGVTSIGDYAFTSCGNMNTLTIPSSVTNIGRQAFSYCGGLKSIEIPVGLTSINLGTFMGCSSLTDMSIPPSVTNIGDWAFSTCTSLKSVEIPMGVTSINSCTFYGCKSLASMTIPSSVTNIGYHAFAYCSSLASMTIPSSVTSIGQEAFRDCGSMVSVTMPESLTSIERRAFYNCTALSSVTIPASVTTIGTEAFGGCTELRAVHFNGNAPVSGENIFDGAPSDMTVYVKNESTGWLLWSGRKVAYDGGGGPTEVTLTVTNIVVHYIQTSELSPMAAPITPDVGIVNVMTEIEGGIVAVPESWATNYPSFKQKFGDDFAVALTRETGKFDANRKPMRVWQDYVAGTDPTDVTDQFRASVTMVEGKPVISYTPVLSETEAAKRVYTIYGKVKLQDEEWTPIPEGQEADYNFFKVTVKMK